MATQYYGTFVGTIWKHKMKQYSAWKETNTSRPLQFSDIKNIYYACKNQFVVGNSGHKWLNDASWFKSCGYTIYGSLDYDIGFIPIMAIILMLDESDELPRMLKQNKQSNSSCLPFWLEAYLTDPQTHLATMALVQEEQWAVRILVGGNSRLVDLHGNICNPCFDQDTGWTWLNHTMIWNHPPYWSSYGDAVKAL